MLYGCLCSNKCCNTLCVTYLLQTHATLKPFSAGLNIHTLGENYEHH